MAECLARSLIEMIAQAMEDAHLGLAGLGAEPSAPVVDLWAVLRACGYLKG